MITYNKNNVIGINGVSYNKHEYIDFLLKNYLENYDQFKETKNDCIKKENKKAMEIAKNRLYEIIDAI